MYDSEHILRINGLSLTNVDHLSSRSFTHQCIERPDHLPDSFFDFVPLPFPNPLHQSPLELVRMKPQHRLSQLFLTLLLGRIF